MGKLKFQLCGKLCWIIEVKSLVKSLVVHIYSAVLAIGPSIKLRT